MWPHTVAPTRPPGTRTRYTSASAPGVVPQMPRKLVTTSKPRPARAWRACPRPAGRRPDFDPGRPRRGAATRRYPRTGAPRRRQLNGRAPPRRRRRAVDRRRRGRVGGGGPRTPDNSLVRRGWRSPRHVGPTLVHPAPTHVPRAGSGVSRHGSDLGSGRAGNHGQLRQSAQHEAIPVPPVQVSGGHREGEMREPAQERPEGQAPSMRASGAPRQ